MQRHLRLALACGCLVCLGAIGCFGDDGGGAGADGQGSGAGTDGTDGTDECPDIGGSWIITAHCEASFIGDSSSVEQNGCDYVASTTGFSCPGSIDGSGQLSHGCDGTDIMCVGGVNGDSIDLDCMDCNVSLQRP